MTQFEALALLARQCAAQTAPALDDDTLVDLLHDAQRYTTWAASTAYTYGAMVRPTTPNGHLYRCLVAGTTHSTEPGYWPQDTAPDARPGLTRPYWEGYVGPGARTLSQITDGSVHWSEAGFDDGQPWDVRAATYAAWTLKAGLASADYDVSTEGDRLHRAQVHQHCLTMAQRFAPTTIA